MPQLRSFLKKGLLEMKIQLPNGQQHILDENIPIEEKIKVVDEITEEWMPTIRKNWNSNSVKFFLDSLGNYLVWHKEPEEKGREDKDVLSRKKMEKMVRFKKTSKTVNFSDLGKEQRNLLFGEGGAE